MEPILAAQRLVVILVLGVWALRLARVRRPVAAPPAAPAGRLLGGGIVALFLLLIGWQAGWTLRAGDLPSFREVERYDPRAWQLRAPEDRREVIDRDGASLIANRAAPDGLRRVYPLHSAAAHLTGYFDRRYGKAGVEAAFDPRLATWRMSAWSTLRSAVDQPGTRLPEPLRLTIDHRLQRAAAAALGSRRGAVVVLNPAAGDLLALVSSPGYDPNLIGPGTFPNLADSPASPLLNRALHGLYPPGSTLKPIVACAALAAGESAATVFEVGPAGYLAPGDDRRIRDFEVGEVRGWSGHGPLDLPGAMARSANGYFARLGVELGADKLTTACRAFGLDRRWRLADGVAGAELISTAGRVPTRRLKPGDTARLAIGQDVLLVTPLQQAITAATIANYGRRVPPRLVAEAAVGAPQQVVEPEVAAAVLDMMIGVVERPDGTGHGLRLAGVRVAGKTGSAENPHGPAHGWTIAFAPAESATVALAVVVENGGTGSRSAVPIAHAILQAAKNAGYLAEPPITPS